jgi:hypothetical protein
MSMLFAVHSAVLTLLFLHPTISDRHSQPVPRPGESPAWHQGGTVFFVADNGIEPSKETMQEREFRPAREIRRFTEPTILLRGSAEDIGLDRRGLAGVLEARFLQDFSFLQTDFAFDKTYETWQIGLFACEAWTVGNNYPIAFHLQCTGGPMDEPRHWQYATLGYGRKDKIAEAVREGLQSIVTEYAAFVRNAQGKNDADSPNPAPR